MTFTKRFMAAHLHHPLPLLRSESIQQPPSHFSDSRAVNSSNTRLKPGLRNPDPLDIEVNLMRLSNVIRIKFLIRSEESRDESAFALELSCESMRFVECWVVLQ